MEEVALTRSRISGFEAARTHTTQDRTQGSFVASLRSLIEYKHFIRHRFATLPHPANLPGLNICTFVTQVITFVGEEYHTSQDTQIHLHRCSDGTIKEYDPSRGNLVVWKPVPSHPRASISHRVAAMHGYDKAEFERSSRQLAF